MKVHCPCCGQTVPAEHVALETGWGKCSHCNEVFPLAQVLEGYTTPSTAGRIERPFDARIVVRREGDRLVVHSPAKGMRAETWGLLGFATFWLAFIAFWTAGALGVFFHGGPIQWVNIGFAAFSTPFWLVGFGMLSAVLWSARSTRTLYLDPYRLVVQWRCGWLRRRRIVERVQVQYARDGRSAVQQTHSEGGVTTQSPGWAVEVVYEKGSFSFPCDTPSERDWLLAEINDFLQSVPPGEAPAWRAMDDEWEVRSLTSGI